MSTGYQGKVLRVNLTNGQTSVEQYDDVWQRTYLGGWGLIGYTLLREVPADCDPLGPDNKLIVANGILTGAPIGGSGRNAFGAKSPLTGGFGAAEAGGFFGAELRLAGWGGIIVEGASDHPVYLWIKGDQVEIRDATHLWGMKTAEAERAIQSELGDPRARVCQIGIAGEKLCLNASIHNDITHVAGRTGLGAVMGSKKLRAIAVRGSQRPDVADAETLRKWAQWAAGQVKTDGSMLKIRHELGTPYALMVQQVAGGLPTRNFSEGYFEGADKLSAETYTGTILKDRETCFACPVRCKRVVETHDKWAVDPTYGGPEYETMAAFGSCCGIDDLPAIAKAAELCNAYGLDTISAGVTIAWAMECYERGLLTAADTGGLDLRFGNAEAMVQLVEDIALRRGFGDLLAQGAYRAAAKIGRGTLQYVMHVKRQEVPLHDPRIKHALDVGYGVSATGADHMHNIHDFMFESAKGIGGLRSLGIHQPLDIHDLSPAKMRLTKRWLNLRAFQNCLGLCMFFTYSWPAQREIVVGLTGWDFSLAEMQEIGERAQAMARVFNYRCGLRAVDDTPPPRFSQPTPKGPNAGTMVPADALAQAMTTYYDMLGYDHATGAPLPWKLHDLGLGWLPEAQ